jgi:YbgC/YbaW family acyl-CoA thioester hydrolase
MTPFTITRRVEFSDTDMAGIMHFSNFFRFMEVGESEFLRSRGISVTWVNALGERVGFPRVSATCDYKTPAKFEDMLAIAVTLEKLGTKSVSYRFDFTRGGDAIATGRLTGVYCRKTADGMVSLAIPDDVRAILTS